MTQTIKTIAGVIAFAIVAVAITVGFLGALSYSVDKTERAECLKWQAEARQFVGYYLTRWQAEQCEAHGVVIDAPIK